LSLEVPCPCNLYFFSSETSKTSFSPLLLILSDPLSENPMSFSPPGTRKAIGPGESPPFFAVAHISPPGFFFSPFSPHPPASWTPSFSPHFAVSTLTALFFFLPVSPSWSGILDFFFPSNWFAPVKIVSLFVMPPPPPPPPRSHWVTLAPSLPPTVSVPESILFF